MAPKLSLSDMISSQLTKLMQNEELVLIGSQEDKPINLEQSPVYTTYIDQYFALFDSFL